MILTRSLNMLKTPALKAGVFGATVGAWCFAGVVVDSNASRTRRGTARKPTMR